jgi:hypothetical protein
MDLARAAIAQDAGVLRKARAYTEFTLPKALLSDEYENSRFTKDDLVIRMVDLTPKEQEASAELGGSSGARIAREMVFASLYKIGPWDPRKDRDSLEEWWEAIGPRCTQLVQAAYVKTQSVEEDDVTSFLASGKKGRE